MKGFAIFLATAISAVVVVFLLPGALEHIGHWIG